MKKNRRQARTSAGLTPVCWSGASGCARRGPLLQGTLRLWRAGPGWVAAWCPCRRRTCPRMGPCRPARKWGRRACSGRECLRGWPSQRYRAGLVEARRLFEGIQDLMGNWFIDGDGHRRAGAGLPAPHGHVADVDAVLPEDAAELADHARAVLVADEEHVLLRHHVEVEAHRPDEPRLHPWPEEGAADGVFAHA